MMKIFKKISNILIMTMIVLFPFVDSYAIRINVPISVDWYFGDEKWNDAPHMSDVKIEPLNGAPLADGKSVYSADGDFSFDIAPEFTGPGKYEYLVYIDNEDIIEEYRQVLYDKTKYRLVFFVQNGSNGLSISAYAYDNDKYVNYPGSASKIAKINFKNNDPHRRGDDDNIIAPNTPDNPDDTPGFNTGDDPDNTIKTPGGTDDPDTNTKDPDNPQSKTGDLVIKPRDRITGKDKTSHTNVKTGIESLGFIIVILLVAIIAYSLTKKKESKVN